MICIVGGRLGAGKTLQCVRLMFDHVCKGRTVCTNVEVDFEQFRLLAARTRGVILQPDQLRYIDPEKDRNWHESIPFGTPGNPVECFLDEVHLFFNSRDWAQTQKNSPGLISFLSQSRKAHVNVTFIVQDSETLDKQFKLQAEWEFFIMSSDHIPLGPLGKFPIRFMLIRKLSAKKGTFISRDYASYDKRIFKLYKSYSFLDEQMKTLGEKAERSERLKLARVPYWRRLMLYFSPRFMPEIPQPQPQVQPCDSPSSSSSLPA